MTCSMDLRMAPWAYFSGEPCYRNEKLDDVFIHSCCCNNTSRIHTNRQNYVPGTLIGSLLPRCQHLTRFCWLHHDMVRQKARRYQTLPFARAIIPLQSRETPWSNLLFKTPPLPCYNGNAVLTGVSDRRNECTIVDGSVVFRKHNSGF